ncbi:hypothetical protein SAMN06296386_101174 [Lachnospiraceae bacterium]|nr:hypothetical protein SAMN06296386_101174 [Lachnospiraceae bacterium]
MGTIYYAIADGFDEGIVLIRARRCNENEQYDLSEFYREYALFPEGHPTPMQFLNSEDLPDRPEDGTFLDLNNHVWILDENELQRYINLNTSRSDAVDEAKKQEKLAAAQKKARHDKQMLSLLSNIEGWHVRSEQVIDEGGHTTIYHHKITIHGQTLNFLEQNVYNFGRVVNPEYALSETIHGGGLQMDYRGKAFWYTLDDHNKWKPVRALTEDEKLATTLIENYGKGVHDKIRQR